MQQTIEEFFHDFRQETLADAEANSTYQLEAFVESVIKELMETGFVEGFEHCHYRTQRGIRVDGYSFHEGALDLFVADFDCRRELETLTSTEVDAAFKRVVNFFEASIQGKLEPDVTTPEYGLVRRIADRKAPLRQINFFLLSERTLSNRFQSFPDGEVGGIKATYHIWDIARLQRQHSSRGRKEPIEIDFIEMFGSGIACLPANLDSASLQSYLVVMPATVLAALYNKYSARLLEQNVRTFLQARGNVNKGIRATILAEPHMFFAYNNGITATAQEVETRMTGSGLQIVRMNDLQIVNGGQTTASLFHTQRKDKADLSAIFVQMKLSVIEPEKSEEVVPRISEYANTQNRVNAADFFSNHPFHIRIEEISRRLWAPAKQGAQRETKWFYERARGQYLDAQSKLTQAEKKRFAAEYPKAQVFTKTDLAKFENVFDEEPKWVNLGSQKNFARFATRVGKNWDKSTTSVNEYYFKRVVARAIVFRRTERLVSEQPWYEGGYRANIVYYTIAVISEFCRRRSKELNWGRIWKDQAVGAALEQALVLAAAFVNGIILTPPAGARNVSEWCKQEACWTRVKSQMASLERQLPIDFLTDLASWGELAEEKKESVKVQIMDDGIHAQERVVNVPASTWRLVLAEGQKRKLLSDKEIGCLQTAAQIPNRIPSAKQCHVILEAVEKLAEDGFLVPGGV